MSTESKMPEKIYRRLGEPGLSIIIGTPRFSDSPLDASTEYVRSDLYATLQREVERLEEENTGLRRGIDLCETRIKELGRDIDRWIADWTEATCRLGEAQAQLSAPQVTEEELNEMAKRFGLAVAASFCEGIRSEWISKLHQPMKEERP